MRQTLRNLVIAALLVVGAMTVRQEVVSADMITCSQLAQQCSIIPQYFLWSYATEQGCDGGYEQVETKCADAAGNNPWFDHRVCVPTNPSTGMPIACNDGGCSPYDEWCNA